MIGQTILTQLKTLGNTDLMAWGSHKFMTFESGQLIKESHCGGLLFKVNGLRHKGHVVISLNGADLYDVRIGSFSKNVFTQKGITLKDIFVESLVETIDNLVEGFHENGKEIYNNVNVFKGV